MPGLPNNITEGKSDPSFTENVKEVFNTFAEMFNWFKNLPENITTLTTEFTSNMYELVSMLILKTPLWIFNNAWFEQTTYKFSLLAIGVVTSLTIIEGIKRKFRKRHMNLKDIGKRWFIVAGLSTVVPFLFYHFFKYLNLISDKIISLNKAIIATPDMTVLPAFDILVLLCFNIVLVGITIPTLLKNARRFFDILTLGLMTPLALTAWIFDSWRHLFNSWWNNLKSLSMVQIVYAFYLMVIGLLLYGANAVPGDLNSAIMKCLFVIGGFTRLMNPPNFVNTMMGGEQGIHSKLKGDGEKAGGKLLKGLTQAYGVYKNPLNLGKRIFAKKAIPNSSTRMGRIHGR